MSQFQQQTLDRRRHPARPDLASSAYRDRYQSDRYVDGVLRSVVFDLADMRPEPRLDRSIDTQLLFGEEVRVFEETPEGWSWAQLGTDGYVGWVPSEALGAHVAPTHQVRALRTFRYPGPDLKYPPLGLVSMGAKVSVMETVTTRGLDYAMLSDGSYVVSKHLVALGDHDPDWVSIAEEFLGTPYLWGGRSSLGLDCSALVQIPAALAGIPLPRDSDMQEAEAGNEIGMLPTTDLQRGDLIFWKGHVAIVAGDNLLLHANGHTMTVAHEDLDLAVKRIAATEWGDITSIRRLA